MGCSAFLPAVTSGLTGSGSGTEVNAQVGMNNEQNRLKVSSDNSQTQKADTIQAQEVSQGKREAHTINELSENKLIIILAALVFASVFIGRQIPSRRETKLVNIILKRLESMKL